MVRKLITVIIIGMLVIAVIGELLNITQNTSFDRNEFIPSQSTVIIAVVVLIVLLIVKYRIKASRKRNP